MDEEEDLSSIAWGAGMGKLVEQQYPNLLTFLLGASVLALPCHLIAVASAESEGGLAFPVVMSVVLLALCLFLVLRIRANAARSDATVRRGGSVQKPLLDGASSAEDSKTLRRVEAVAWVCGTLGYASVGWSFGLSTYCAYNKANDRDVRPGDARPTWEECYAVSHAVAPGGTALPPVYFDFFLAALLASAAFPTLWFILFKIVRQVVRPPRAEQRSADGLRELPQTAMFALAVSVGTIAGSGAWVFRQMIGLVHNVFFLQFYALRHEPFAYDANQHTPPPGVIDEAGHHAVVPLPLIILSPVLGGLVVAFLVQNWAPEAKGHGVPEVMDAIHYKSGRIRPSVAGVKILASSFSIGSGGSVGREGPIIQIGSTFGSIVGVLSGCSVAQRVTLIACGAAGGIAATFNTPIGGVVFAVELMLPASNSRTLMPLGIAATVATYIGRATLGLHPAFDIPDLQSPQATVEGALSLLTFVPFGVLVGLVSVVFVKGIYYFEDFFDAMPGSYYSRHAVGMLCQGVLICLMMAFTGSHADDTTGGGGGHPLLPSNASSYGHYYVQGVGYATVKDLLEWTPLHNKTGAHASALANEDAISNPTFCLLLFLAKFVSTFCTIGSGASGGIFSPSLYIGATLGGMWGHIISTSNDPLAESQVLWRAAAFSPIQACVAGMAGMVAGSTGASITAITMTFEMTRDYATILPIIITTVLAHMTRKAISEDSIYTLKLVRRGHVVPEGLQAAVHAAQRVQDVMSPHFRILSPEDAMTVFDGVTLVCQRPAPTAAAPVDMSGAGSAAGAVGAVGAAGSGSGPEQRAEPAHGLAASGGGPAGSPTLLACACGPIRLDLQHSFGRGMTAAQYAAASGDAERPLCLVTPAADFHGAIRQMDTVGAEILLVCAEGDAPNGGRAADVVGVVTSTAICHEISMKSQLMSRDRTLGTRSRKP